MAELPFLLQQTRLDPDKTSISDLINVVSRMAQDQQLLMNEIFEERIGGLNLGDVFTGGDDDILTLNLSDNPGLIKVADQLTLQISGTDYEIELIDEGDGSLSLGIPTRPGFQAVPSETQTDIAINTNVTVVFATEIFDLNGDFAGNTFTAPVAGKYHFDVSLALEEIDQAATYYKIVLVTSNKSFNYYLDPTRFSGDLAQWMCAFSVLADMDTNDTAYITVYQAAGAQQADIRAWSWFSGHLVAV